MLDCKFFVDAQLKLDHHGVGRGAELEVDVTKMPAFRTDAIFKAEPPKGVEAPAMDEIARGHRKSLDAFIKADQALKTKESRAKDPASLDQKRFKLNAAWSGRHHVPDLSPVALDLGDIGDMEMMQAGFPAVIKRIDLNAAGFGWYYDGWYYVTGEGRSRATWHFSDVGSRRIGGLSHASNWNADDHDRIYAYAESGLWLNFTPEIDGRIMWIANLDRYYDSSYRQMNDEYGSSQSTIRQETYSVGGLFSNAGFTNRQFRRMAVSHYRGNGDSGRPGSTGEWPNFGPTALSSPSERFVTGAVGGRVAKNQPINLMIGVRAELDATLDDVGINFWQGSGWYIKDLWIQVSDY